MNFSSVVEENGLWLLRYLQRAVGNRDTAEDLLQETFIRAYKAWDGYSEAGQLRSWLRTIARNVAFRHMQRQSLITMTLVPEISDITALPVSHEPEQSAENAELRKRLLSAIAHLPDEQGTVIYYRYIKDFSISEVADLTNLPRGSVKSKAYYGLAKIRKSMAQYFVEGGYVMNCKDAYVYLWQYAKGKINAEDSSRVAEHLSVCDDCKAKVEALKALVSHITPVADGEVQHYQIAFPLQNSKSLYYSGGSFDVPQWKEMTEQLAETGGRIPEGEDWFGAGHDNNLDHIGEFDNDGNRIEFQLYTREDNPFPDNVRVRYLRMKQVFPRHEINSVYIAPYSLISSNLEAPGLRVGKMQNHLGNYAKSALYLAIPAKAENTRIKRGNGILDCGTFKFAYSERYITEDETMKLECTFIEK